ncbi:hypothetical protein I4U23_010746 [Adineta vaga]|nr:hypothetical protein I4U23_010746 [Adineta vaga]
MKQFYEELLKDLFDPFISTLETTCNRNISSTKWKIIYSNQNAIFILIKSSSIEQHLDWITECLNYLRKHQIDTIEATNEAEDAWINQVNAIANETLVNTANSWYLGANVPRKPRIFMPYAGGIVPYRQKCDHVAANNYEGFQLKKITTK